MHTPPKTWRDHSYEPQLRDQPDEPRGKQRSRDAANGLEGFPPSSGGDSGGERKAANCLE